MKNVDKLQKDKHTKFKEDIFISNPNLKFKKIIINSNYSNGFNDIFEIFKSFNKIYLASPNKNEYIIDIINIENSKLFISLKGHNNFINQVKYFKNKNNNNEYLISVDKNNVIIIWNINNNYSKFYKIESYISKGFISGIILTFNILDSTNKENNYIIFSFNCKIYTYVYSLDYKVKIKTIKKTNEYNTYYLIFWTNQKDNNNYIIELSDRNIFIYNVINDDILYCNLKLGPFDYSKNNCGFIYNKNNTDFLIISSPCGNIMIWDLISKCMYYNISLYKNLDKNKLYLSYILQWSNKYIIACEYYYKGFKIIDIDNFKIISSIKVFYLILYLNKKYKKLKENIWKYYMF